VIADAVLAGGIRRAACISFFSFDDEEMTVSKYNGWAEKYPYRARANNSALLLRHRIKEEEFYEYFDKMWASGTGEPGFLWSNDKDTLANPCGEISLKASGGFCNLTTLNAEVITSQEELNAHAKAAAFIGTLQASYTDFHFLNENWKDNAEKDALIGVSITGVASGTLDNLDLKQAANIVKDENARVAKLIGINKAARCTTLKPEGTASLLLGTSSGIHAWYNDHYIRRIRVGKDEAVHQYLNLVAPERLEDEYFKPKLQSVFSVPVKAPEGALTRKESALELLKRVKRFNIDWIHEGHRRGNNYNNVSCTISLKEEEVEEIKKWLWDNREYYNGITIEPYDGKNYIQAPHEDITEEQYEKLLKEVRAIDFSLVFESEDGTAHSGELACGVGGCDLK
jgi:ribonucleoside-diphosphate reductase alpha chain